MMQQTIKVGAITHLTDARFFAAYAVEFLGFCFDPQSTLYLSPAQALAIKGWINGPRIVAEFAHQDAENVREIITFVQPDVVQVPYAEYAQLRPLLLNIGLPVIVEYQAHEQALPLDELVIYYLLKDRKDIPEGMAPGECMFPLDAPYDIQSLPAGTAIQLSGSPEEATGIKSYDAIADWLEQLS